MISTYGGIGIVPLYRDNFFGLLLAWQRRQHIVALFSIVPLESRVGALLLGSYYTALTETLPSYSDT